MKDMSGSMNIPIVFDSEILKTINDGLKCDEYKVDIVSTSISGEVMQEMFDVVRNTVNNTIPERIWMFDVKEDWIYDV